MTTWDNDAFAQAVECHRDMVFRIAYTYMRDAADADDIAQTVFIKLLSTGPSFSSADHLKNWLIRVTANECKSLFRKPWRRVEDIEAYANTLAMPTREHSDLFVHVMCLPERYRVPIVLFYYGGCSTEEIAEALRLKPPAVRTRLARGRAKLKVMMKEESNAKQEHDSRDDAVHARI